MYCPQGKIVNPLTGKCIDAGGYIAQNLAKKGYIADYEVRPYAARRVTRRQRVPRLSLVEPAVCREGYVRSQTSGRCIKISGKTYKRAYIPAANAIRRTNSEGRIAFPVGTASVAPLAARETVLHWSRVNCKNDRDPYTGIPFASADANTLQDLIRLHNRTCVLSGPMNTKVVADHKAGQVGTVPDDPTNHLTLDDYKALRDSIRRKNPGYKLPMRKHQPPPPSWQLYVSPDNRSGSNFASVMYVDTTKLIQTPQGVQYPVDSVKVDMGFIPMQMNGAVCAPRMIGELLSRLAADNRLLTPVAGGWKPIAGFPFTKKYWMTPDAKERFSKLCRELTKALTSSL
jgi:hypothetical protein